MKCKECNGEFVPANPSQLYCCVRCRITANNRRKCAAVRKQQTLYKRECAICATPFSTYMPQKICCSKECSAQHHRQKGLKNHYKRRKEKKRPCNLAMVSLLAREAGMTYGEYVKVNGI